MVNEIEAKEVSVGKLFSPDFIFTIPIYQRPLSWDKENFDQLFEDIYDAMTNKETQYFLGSIILQECEADKNKYYIVDGQQRISTLAILMAVIRDYTKNENLRKKLASYLYQEEDEFKGIPEERRIMPWEDLEKLFNETVYKVGGTNIFIQSFENGEKKRIDKEEPKYHLYEAIGLFYEKLEEYFQEDEKLEQFVKYLLNNVCLVYIKTNTVTSAFRLFNVLNARGLALNTSDLLKSENIGEIKDEKSRVKYANIWRKNENELGREELENVIGFIRTIKLKERAKMSIYEEYRKLVFGNGLLNKGSEFIDYLDEISTIYSKKIIDADIAEGNNAKKNEFKNIINLMNKYVPFADWKPPFIAFCQKFKADNYLLDFIKLMEKKVIIEWIGGFSPTERITSLNKIIKLIELENDPTQIIEKVLYFNIDESSTGRISRVLDYSKKDSIEALLLERLNDNQFYTIYGGKLAKYILLRIDMEYLELENFQGYPGTVTVEHILPQSPEEGSEWTTIFTKEEREEWTNKLGNLALLSGIKNSKAQNFGFSRKKCAYFKDKITPFRTTQYLENIEVWNINELKKRHEMLIETAKKIFLSY